LIGKNTCGSYLYLYPTNEKKLYTGSVIYNEGLIILKGSESKIKIPFVFEYRMVDYYGNGNNDGIIGGYDSSGGIKTNLTYQKKIGIDILPKNMNLFSFDINVQAKYKASSVGDVRI